MKIDKEKFNQLKQLDRVEYRQKQYSIKENYSFNIHWNFFLLLVIIGLMFISLGMSFFNIALEDIDGGKNEGVEVGFKVLEVSFEIGVSIIFISFIFLCLEIIISLILGMKRYKEFKELEEEYFSVEVKK